MIIIKDTVSIKATPSDIFHWFEHLDEHYISWHPAHVSCRYLKKQTLEAGAVLYAEEYLHGKLHKFKLYIKDIIPGQGFQYRITPGVQGSFQFLENEGGADVYAEVRIGWSLPFIGKFIDIILNLLFSNIINNLKRHMNEEGVNLHSLLEQQKSANENILPDAVRQGERSQT